MAFMMTMRVMPDPQVPPADHRPGSIRRELESTIERLIAMLDAMDGDADEEDTDPREDDAGDACEIDEDREPALGWTNGESQTFGVAHFGDVSAYDEDEDCGLGEIVF